MRATRLDVFDKTVQKTQVWLNDLMAEMAWENDRHRAYLALRTVLHALRDRLTVEEAVHLGAQLPMLVRGVYYEGWKVSGKPVRERHKGDFLAHVEAAFKHDEKTDPEKVTRAVLKVLCRHVTEGETQDIKGLLPAELRKLWP